MSKLVGSVVIKESPNGVKYAKVIAEGTPYIGFASKKDSNKFPLTKDLEFQKNMIEKEMQEDKKNKEEALRKQQEIKA